MVAKRTNRFTTGTDTGSVLSGIQQSIDPKFNKAFIRRNLKPFPGMPQNPGAYRKKSDAALRKLATTAVLKEHHITIPKPRRKKKKA